MRADAITLDTNVVEHLFRTEPQGMNADGHVTELLGKVLAQRRTLCRDHGGRMENEMLHRLAHYRTHRELGNFQNLLRGLLELLPKKIIQVNQGDGLMNCIDQRVPGHTEQSDKVIMYVACQSDTLLVSNNDVHITNHARKLKKCASHHAGTTPEFCNSRTANTNL